jgi:hypothetical protein
VHRLILPPPVARRSAWLALFAVLAAALPDAGRAQTAAHPLRGLWIGQATLNYVTEVSVPLDRNNTPIAPEPRIPTPTADQAHLRLILHVNGAGQAHLLKDVVILNRKGSTNQSVGTVNLTTNPNALADSTVPATDSDVVLVTDERLYSTFPAQSALRFASAVFDFGDRQATDVVNDLVARAATNAASFVRTSSTSLASTANQLAVISSASNSAFTAASPVVANADVAAAFASFLSTHLPSTKVTAIAAAANPTTEAAAARAAAVATNLTSIYRDTRPVDMVDAIVAAVSTNAAAARTNAAHNMAAAHADVNNVYHSFLASELVGDMITAAAGAAASNAITTGATLASVRGVVTNPGPAKVVEARTEALRRTVPPYTDTRATDAVLRILNAIATSAGATLPATNGYEEVRTAALQAGRNELTSMVLRYPVLLATPTPDYTSFVRASAPTGMVGSAQIAARAAASGAVSEKALNPLFTAQSLEDAARTAALNALQSVYSAAARAVRTELPLTGRFGPGNGDPRLTWDIKLAPLGAAGLTGSILLPANHPTNPFRHRRHPDHTVGLDVTRNLRFDFDGAAGSAPARAGFGVDRVTGTYREEIFGLHKKLGPQQNLGLRVEGKFELHRISLVDTLNAR